MKYKAELLIIESDGTEWTAEASALNTSMLDKAIDRYSEGVTVKVLMRWSEED